MKTKHTPGPWLAHTSNMTTIQAANGQTVATPDGGFLYGRAEDETEANARLIAAAPELLSALQECQEFLGGPWTAPEDVILRSRAAIAKATGEA